MNRRRLTVFAIAFLLAGIAAWLVTGELPGPPVAHAAEDACGPNCTRCGGHEGEDHDGHGHKEAAHEDHDDHGREKEARETHDDHGHERDARDDHDEHARDEEAHDDHADEAPVVHVSPDQAREFGVRTAKAGPGKIERRVRLPGEILLNSDRAAHIVPRAEGIVLKVHAGVGDHVKAGQVLAVIESGELGAVQSKYLAALNEIICCTIDLTRAEALQGSLAKLLALLDTGPSLDDLLEADFAHAAEGHSKLISAYAERVLSRTAYEREKKLLDSNASSLAEFQRAESAYKKAYAGYVATRDALKFETTRTMLEARRGRKNTELEVKAMERKLRVLGLSDDDLKELDTIITGGKPACGPDCKDPDCLKKAQEAVTDVQERLGRYTLRVPFDGIVIEKHLVLGEKVSGDTNAFTVSDMSSVWVDLGVYQKDLPYVRKGQTVHIAAGDGIPDVEGAVAHVLPIVDPKTRTGTARVVVPNPKLELRPGLFVSADVHVGEADIPVMIPKRALRRIEDRAVVFVPTDDGFRAKGVQAGRRSGTHVEIVSGLKPGEAYVVDGAFELQAKIVTGGLGAHAGHGH